MTNSFHIFGGKKRSNHLNVSEMMKVGLKYWFNTFVKADVLIKMAPRILQRSDVVIGVIELLTLRQKTKGVWYLHLWSLSLSYQHLVAGNFVKSTSWRQFHRLMCSDSCFQSHSLGRSEHQHHKNGSWCYGYMCGGQEEVWKWRGGLDPGLSLEVPLTEHLLLLTWQQYQPGRK